MCDGWHDHLFVTCVTVSPSFAAKTVSADEAHVHSDEDADDGGADDDSAESGPPSPIHPPRPDDGWAPSLDKSSSFDRSV